MLCITCDAQVYCVDTADARLLELKLNVTSKGREWKDIGDALFAFHTGNSTCEDLCVTQEQFIYLKRLTEYSLHECRKLTI